MHLTALSDHACPPSSDALLGSVLSRLNALLIAVSSVGLSCSIHWDRVSSGASLHLGCNLRSVTERITPRDMQPWSIREHHGGQRTTSVAPMDTDSTVASASPVNEPHKINTIATTTCALLHSPDAWAA